MIAMTLKRIASLLLSEGRDVVAVERACVAGYMTAKGIAVPHGSYLKHYLAEVDDGLARKCHDEFKPVADQINFETLIELFELLTESGTRKKNGVAYTPLSVKRMMLDQVLRGVEAPKVFDPSCGCASFLLTAAQMIHDRCRLPYRKVVKECIFGADIDAGALDKTRALFAMLLAENEECGDASPELFELDMLDAESVTTILKAHPGGFDCVVGNPPYVRFRNMDEETKAKVTRWTAANCGNPDLYMPFFEVGMSLVSDGGTLAYITSNTYLQSLNGRCLRNWMSDSKLSVEITDFRNTQLFSNVTCYTCVTTLREHGEGIRYRRAERPDSVSADFTFYPFASFAKDAPWRMRSPDVDAIIKKLEGTGTPLSRYVIRNGLATLANNVYFFKPSAEDGTYFHRIYDGVEWKIEKALCRNVVKPNIVHNEEELQREMEKAIFPYVESGGKYVIIQESLLRNKFPCAYDFLCHCRKLLDCRDKGKGEYPAWYAYGRTQGMNCTGCKLLIPYIAGAGTAVLSTDRDLLFYCGYALINDDVDELRYIKAFIESDAFWYYLHHTSKPYSKGFMALAKNYIVRFSIPSLPKKERRSLLEARTLEARNRLVWKAYECVDNACRHRGMTKGGELMR